MAFTPGPWRWVIDRDTIWDEASPLGTLPDMDGLVSESGRSVLGGAWHNDSTAGVGLDSDTPEADARLIAAAPEMLAALKAAECEPYLSSYTQNLISAAIRKAEGE